MVVDSAMKLDFCSMPIARKLPLGLGVLVLLIVAMALMGRFGLTSATSGLRAFEAVTAKALLVGHVEAEVNTLNGATTIYAAQGGDQALTDSRQGVERIERLLTQLAALDGEAAALAAKYRAPLGAYKTALDKIAEARGMRDLLFRNEISRNHGSIGEVFTAGIEDVTMGGNFQDALDLSQIRDRYMRGMNSLMAFMSEPTPALKDDAIKSFNAAKFDAEQLDAASRNKETKDTARRIATRLVSHIEAASTLGPLVEEAQKAMAEGVTPSIRAIEQVSEAAFAQSRQMMEAVRQSTDTAAGQLAWTMLLLAGVAALLAALVAVTLFRAIVPPVRALTRAMNAFATGDWSHSVAGVQGKDEIGAMARAVLVFKENGLAHDALKSESEREQEARFRRQQELEAAIAGFEQASASVVHSVAQSASELESAARSMATTAEETSSQANSVAAASEQATVNVQGLAEAGERLSQAIAEISQQVAASSRIGAAAVQEAGALDSQLRELSASGERIVSVVSIINGLADQTNLLALNATIEAARAGEAGRGFAVVASEVKALAGQTGRATGEIAAIVAGIRDVTSQTINAVNGMTRTIAEMDQIATMISAAVEEQSITTREMAGGVRDTARGAEEVTVNIAGVRQASDATGSAATQVLAASADLNDQSARLRQEIDLFLDRVRAA
jgi:methyl-accepting chemotaxis protein